MKTQQMMKSELLKTQFPLECEELPLESLNQEELIVVNKCMARQELNDEEFTLLKTNITKILWGHH